MIDTLAVVGATGAVGRIILDMLAARKFPAKRLKLLGLGDGSVAVSCEILEKPWSGSTALR